MPPLSLDDLTPFLPLLPWMAALLLPPLGALVTTALVASLGLDDVQLPGLPGLRWSRAAGALALLVGGCVVVAVAAEGARPLATSVVAALLRLGAAGACLLVGAWASGAPAALAEGRTPRDAHETRAPFDPRDPRRPAPELDPRTLALALGGLAALATLVGAGGAVLLLGGLAVAFGAVALYGGDLAAVLRDALRDVAAGIELRARVTAGAVVPVDGQPHTLAAHPGLLTTRLSDGTDRHNRYLLAALAEPAPAGPTAAGALSARTPVEPGDRAAD